MIPITPRLGTHWELESIHAETTGASLFQGTGVLQAFISGVQIGSAPLPESVSGAIGVDLNGTVQPPNVAEMMPGDTLGVQGLAYANATGAGTPALVKYDVRGRVIIDHSPGDLQR